LREHINVGHFESIDCGCKDTFGRAKQRVPLVGSDTD
jgi:hypothetical protein